MGRHTLLDGLVLHSEDLAEQSLLLLKLSLLLLVLVLEHLDEDVLLVVVGTQHTGVHVLANVLGILLSVKLL